MYNTLGTVYEKRKQKVGDKMTTTKAGKISLNTFDDKIFYVNYIKLSSWWESICIQERSIE